MARRWRRGWGVGTAVLGAFVLSGCPAVPYAPGPSFAPSGPPAAAVPPRTPDVVLTGRLQTFDGASDDVRTEVWFDPVTSVPRITRRHPQGWLSVQLATSGRITVSNAEQVGHRAVGSVTVGVVVGYPVDSLVCRHTPPDGPAPRGSGRCWFDLTLFDGVAVGERGEPLSPGQQRSATFGVPTRTAVTLVAPAEDLDALTRTLAHPVDVVAFTNPRIDAPAVTLADACPGASGSEPSAAAGSSATPTPTGDDREQHVVVGTLRPGTCADWPN